MGRHGTPMVVAAGVAAALDAGQPVVALESTLVAHGLPRPRNLVVAGELEELLRDRGVVAATVAVIDGVPTIGLDAGELARIAGTDPDPGSGSESGPGTDLEPASGPGSGGADGSSGGVAKLSVRDLPVAMALRRTGATTVASTALLAARAGIRVFATGGLGGVHRDGPDGGDGRDARQAFDESADLAVLARTPITVVCAGVKSILDVGATLERLETANVTVLGWRTSTFPGFYLSATEFGVDWRVEQAADVAAVMAEADSLGLPGAVVVANPLPTDLQMDRALHDRVLADALADAARRGVRGKAVTPFLLDAFHRGTGGASLEANVAAVRNNAAVAADIATAWSELTRRR